MSPSHHFGMTEILLKGRKKPNTHPSIPSCAEMKGYSERHCPNVDFLSVNIVNTMTINLLTFCEQHVNLDRKLS